MGPVLIHVDAVSELRSALADAGLTSGGPVVVCVGGADAMTTEVEEAVTALLRDHLMPAMGRWGVTVVDGGTDSGVMRALGRARQETGARCDLVGVAASGTVALPGTDAQSSAHGLAPLEPHHTHTVLVPGDAWGDESPWISDVASALAGASRSVTLLVNGGQITLDDAEHSLSADRPLVVLAGSGRAANAIADASAEARAARIAADERTHIAPLSDGAAVLRTLEALLTGGRSD